MFSQNESKSPGMPKYQTGLQTKQMPKRTHFSLSMQAQKKNIYSKRINILPSKKAKSNINMKVQSKPPQSPKSGFRHNPFFSVISRIRVVIQPDVASPLGTACPRRGLRLVKHLPSRKANCTHVFCVSQIKRQSSKLCAKGCSSLAMLFQFGRMGCVLISGKMNSRKRSPCRRVRLFFYIGSRLGNVIMLWNR